MKHRATLLILLLVATARLSLGATGEHGAMSSAVVAKLALPHERVLPGVPFDMVVTFTNTSAQRVTVGTIASLIVTLPDGSTFAPPEHRILQPHLLSSPETAIELGPKESTERALTWDHADPGSWASYAEISRPGTYALTLELVAGRDDDEETYVGTIRTSSVRLERVVPLGEDEAIWQKMQDVSGGEWSDDGFLRLKQGNGLAEDIIKLHPRSSYYPYALLLKTQYWSLVNVDEVLQAARDFPDSPAQPYLVKAAGDHAYSEGIGAQIRNDEAAADKFYALAEQYYRKVPKTANVAVQDEVARNLRISAARGRLGAEHQH